eukprot:CAMPEP_0177211034 /NCGR_PEP_ID=MMETSP0367-20130122/31873_1 /TAXON_ID=447022 ORGANISM="Scrippsiella hangoei-like, Strain SHHI-4" /NCGR_SAMPLE_ID=MMETSP0367 /ASSEMBLY_ACC=CAM_ASM_000362 /LENGTH=50 /DNA_ID=CAMNT_0018660185 /DNA_START=78 /DNA_END=226 /DNA_ORIENTATION=-
MSAFGKLGWLPSWPLLQSYGTAYANMSPCALNLPAVTGRPQELNCFNRCR